MKRRWVLRHNMIEAASFCEHGITEHLQFLVVTWLNNRIARSLKWGPRFEVRMERVR